MSTSRASVRKPLLVLMLIMVGAGLYLTGLAVHQGPDARPLAAQNEPPQFVPYVWPLYDEAMAITESLSVFPVGHNPHGEVARLLPYSAIDDWRAMSSPGMSSNAPAWIVGILGDDLTVEDVMAAHSPGLDEIPNADTEVDGAFYVWDANSGELAGVGVLHSASDRNYASLASLQSQGLAIDAATLVPAYPTYEFAEDPTDVWP